jgi:hypothetical protein
MCGLLVLLTDVFVYTEQQENPVISLRQWRQAAEGDEQIDK